MIRNVTGIQEPKKASEEKENGKCAVKQIPARENGSELYLFAMRTAGENTAGCCKKF